jgi:hypothetical protein
MDRAPSSVYIRFFKTGTHTEGNGMPFSGMTMYRYFWIYAYLNYMHRYVIVFRQTRNALPGFNTAIIATLARYRVQPGRVYFIAMSSL